MVQVNKLPENLRPYESLGIELTYDPIEEDAVGECPWCNKKKFSVAVSTGVWRCFSCATGNRKGGGNASIFVRTLWESCVKTTRTEFYEELAHDRKLLFAESLQTWGAVKSILTGECLVPGYLPNGNIGTLYRYQNMRNSKGEWKRKLIPTPTLGHHVHGIPLYADSKPLLYVCEGYWDGVALWEVMSRCGLGVVDKVERLMELVPGMPSLTDDANIIAVPGASMWNPPWSHWTAGKRVRFLYDNDYPVIQPSGLVTPPAGFTGMNSVAERMYSSGKQRPSTIEGVLWGEEGYDQEYANGFDVRDFLSQDTN